ncbi:MAG: hypothetical protein ACHP84_19740 [Caulobacterales bacterium]
MDAVVDSNKLRKRELVVRVAVLELLVADLIHLLRQVAPAVVDELAAEAVTDRDGQFSHAMPAGLEHQRLRLHDVLEERARSLNHKRFSRRLSVQRFPSTD